MASDDQNSGSERFLRFLFIGNITFTIFITVACVFLFILGMNSIQLLGSLLFMTMLYLMLTAYWGYEIRSEIRKDIKD